MPTFDLSELPAGEPYRILSSLVLPRPIAWITTVDADTGVVNAAPFSFFNLIGSDPPICAVGVRAEKDRTAEPKDTARNLSHIGVGFVVNLVDEDNAVAMNETAVELPAHESEIEHAGLTLAPTVTVAPVPRIASAPASLECRVAEVVTIGNNRVVIASIGYVHLRDDLWDADKRRVLAERAHLVGRMHGGSFYTRTRDLFSLDRPK